MNTGTKIIIIFGTISAVGLTLYAFRDQIAGYALIRAFQTGKGL